ncbi:hypothetical protein S2M10_39370 [Sphingomonas sp. S2M10]|uniref:hypothetical protein n=1 Tax=Sphingomonas sp. S2M10 TaxID=2705010 RepID=UPI00145647E2|nr:hypothetical protein [Sphingomonas sp. S2M10]NLS28924.1 hypothetical protein [Sphingomonas sp. S2M10]
MSTAVVRAEIARFLSSPEPEVLCISGHWGVGKTYSWRMFYEEAERNGRLGMSRYAYVSLFGLATLADLRSAVVENTVVAGGNATPDAHSLYDMLRRGEKLARKSRVAIDIAAGFFRMKDAGDALYRAAFLSVQRQMICFDDLERAGKSLEMRDLLGLASMLREQRNCKVVLLLNKERVDKEQQEELDRQLEKVVDTFLVFEPTSLEAAAIAIAGEDMVANTLRERLASLNITNMRVMKKIERWARIIEQELAGSEKKTLEQATATVVLCGWCFLQRDLAPTLDFVRSFNSMSGLFKPKEEPPQQARWRDLLRAYNYGSTDELDEMILGGVLVGYFDGGRLRAAAKVIEEKRRHADREDSYSKAWELYHKSLAVDDADVLDAMHAGARENLTTITPVNMNSSVRFLRRYGRDTQASELVEAYVEANRSTPNFFKQWDRFLGADPIDPEFKAAMDAGRAAIVDERDPAEMLRQIAQSGGFNPEEDAARLGRLSVNDLVGLFDQYPGDAKEMMEWAGRIARHAGSEALSARVAEAIGQIAARSPMRADKLRNWGVWPPIPDAAAGS